MTVEKSKAEASIRAAQRQNSLSSTVPSSALKQRHSDIVHAQSTPNTPQTSRTPAASASSHDRYSSRSLSVPHVPSPTRQSSARHSATHNGFTSKNTSKLTSPKFTTPIPTKYSQQPTGTPSTSSAFKKPIARHSQNTSKIQSALNPPAARTPSRNNVSKHTPARIRSVSSYARNGVKPNETARTPAAGRPSSAAHSAKYHGLPSPAATPHAPRSKSPSFSQGSSRTPSLRSAPNSVITPRSPASSFSSSTAQPPGDNLSETDFRDKGFSTVLLDDPSATYDFCLRLRFLRFSC